MDKNQVRIIAGKWRGRKITFNEAEGLRPTSDRVRETLFNWISMHIPESRCLDLFAGSGALGIEALSRGAAELSFVDNNRNAIQCIQNALNKLDCNRGKFYCHDAAVFINKNSISLFDIIFIDPPYAKFDLLDFIESLESAFDTEKSYLIFYEHQQQLQENNLPDNWLIQKNKKAGKVHYYLLKRIPPLKLISET